MQHVVQGMVFEMQVAPGPWMSVAVVVLQAVGDQGSVPRHLDRGHHLRLRRVQVTMRVDTWEKGLALLIMA